ncbi:hypothetical protein K2173_010500 [Erythroxylum novogranatense]|uniref:J domain-containing protein n=1 Tax=Erythroxylum novogranatense TaxID=1862640 RepID=A0AAV8TDT3_9ROSI|nr:hypothetical protein K2173_010500 [Erythroxylum novogranatense]
MYAATSAPHPLQLTAKQEPFRIRSPKFRIKALARVKEKESLYEVLQVKQSASQREIKTAYRTLAKLYHPDALKSDGQDFIEIHNAYETLSDPAARALYDMSFFYKTKRAVVGVGYYQTRRWETDQCW